MSVRYLRSYLRDDVLTATATGVLILLIVAGAFGSLLPVGSPDQIGFTMRLAPPSWVAPLGSDQLGRSELARILEGVRTTFLLSTAAVLLAGMFGVFVGIVAAYLRKATDEVATRLADIMFSFPPILLGLLITAIIGPGVISAIAAIMLITFPIFVRVVRAAALDVAGRDFVVVSEIIGASFLRRVFVHLLPNVAGAVVVQTVYSISFGMLIESALSFLGLGVQPPAASLGSLLREANQYLGVAPWLTFDPGVVLALAILSVNLVGDGLRRIVDPLVARRLV